MAGVTVFVFLLEKLPGLEIILNTTLLSAGTNTTINFDKCDPTAANLIWKNINQDDNKNVVLHNKINSMLRNMAVKSEYYEKSELNLEKYYFQNEIPDDYSGFKKESEDDGKDLPKGAPYLVAIFETVRNITAQTCGGTLLSPHWVVTPAACLDVLANYKYGNESKYLRMGYKNRYSIVANAVNPVEDGTVHNVTEIFIHPNNLCDSIKHPNETFGNCCLALMKIEPWAEKLTSVKIFKNKIKKVMEVRVFGWILKKNSTGQDSMSIASFTAKTLDSTKCKSYRFPHKSVICFRANESNKIQISQMSSGGPVMVFYEDKFRLLGAVHLDVTADLIVYLFAPHYDWITSIIGKK